MAKPDRDDLLQKGNQLLKDWGLGDETGVRDLATFAGRELAGDLAIANRLGGIASDESVQLLLRLERKTSDKHVRKETRRALYRLQQRGLQLPKQSEPAPEPIISTSLEGYLSAFDGRGDQLAWILKPRPGGVAHLFAVINDPEGMREADFNVVTRKVLKTLRDQLAAKHDLRLVGADWRYCDFLMSRAFRWARERATRVTGDYPALRAQIIKEPAADDLAPLVLSRLDSAAVRSDPDILAHSDDLLEEKEFRTWFLGREPLAPYLDELSQVKDSPLTLNQMQQEERLTAVINRAVEELFSGERRDSWARRLYEMAYFFSCAARELRAKQAVAAAHALAQSERGGRDIPFFEQLTRVSLAVFFENMLQQEDEREKTSLIVTPQQLRAEQRRRQAGRG